MPTTHPKAEQFAQTMQLPLTVCPVTKELYGYAKPILDVQSAKKTLSLNGFLGAAAESALSILHERFAILEERR